MPQVLPRASLARFIFWLCHLLSKLERNPGATLKKYNILAAAAALACLMSVPAHAEGNLTPAYVSGTTTIYGYQDPATCLVWAQPTALNLAPALRYQTAPGNPSGST